jgi:hypothetical protein
MALTNAERQARYRERQTAMKRAGGKGRARFSGYLALLSTWRLKNLAAYHGISQGEVLDLALKALEDGLLETIEDLSLRAAYSDGRLRKDGTVVQ